MKTKSLLMIAATLAATVISSQAQVYSQNIVGYVNVVFVGASGYTLVANPLDDGAGNQLTNVIGNLPNKSQVITWNGAGYDTAFGKNSTGWGANTNLPPGVGFFVKNGISSSPSFTNTFAGSLVVASGASVTNGLGAGYTLVGSKIPYAGDATTDTNINFPALANKSQLISWNSGSQGFDTAVGKITGGWGAAFPITVGQGFFVNNAKAATNWVQVAP